MRYLRKTYCLAVLFGLMALACAKPSAEVPLNNAKSKDKQVHIAIHGWHSGIIIKKVYLSADLLPEAKDFPDSEYLEFGWGDWDYYQAPDPGLSLALKAVFWPTRSVLHVAGFDGRVESFFPDSEIIQIALSDEAFLRLVSFISDTFQRPAMALPPETGPGLYGKSRFYPAQGRFHLFRTCNTWVAEALQSAGLPVSTASVITVGSLRHQLESSHGHRIGPRLP